MKTYVHSQDQLLVSDMMDMNDFSGLFQLGKFAKIYIYMQINAYVSQTPFLK